MSLQDRLLKLILIGAVFSVLSCGKRVDPAVIENVSELKSNEAQQSRAGSENEFMFNIGECGQDLDWPQRYSDRVETAILASTEGSPLLATIYCDDLNGLKKLLLSGADPQPAELRNSPIDPIFLASDIRGPAYLEALLQHGADPNTVVNGSTSTALSASFEQGMRGEGWENYYYLLENGADINLVHSGTTIALFAETLNQHDKVMELLERGYQARLIVLANRYSDSAQIPEFMLPEKQVVWRRRVRARFESMGISYPIPREAVVKSMTEDR